LVVIVAMAMVVAVAVVALYSVFFIFFHDAPIRYWEKQRATQDAPSLSLLLSL
jgi:hypothetical protein